MMVMVNYSDNKGKFPWWVLVSLLLYFCKIPTLQLTGSRRIERHESLAKGAGGRGNYGPLTDI